MKTKLHLRTCVACRTIRPQNELIRITVNQAGQAVIDQEKKLGGRGTYVCNQECLRIALDRNLLPSGLFSVTRDS